jgi:hypothetical protein
LPDDLFTSLAPNRLIDGRVIAGSAAAGSLRAPSSNGDTHISSPQFSDAHMDRIIERAAELVARRIDAGPAMSEAGSETGPPAYPASTIRTTLPAYPHPPP